MKSSVKGYDNAFHLQEDKNGRLKGSIPGRNGVDFRCSLNPQPSTSFYEYTGTATALMRGTREPIKVHGKVVSVPIHVGRPKGNHTIEDMINQEVRLALFKLEQKCVGQACEDYRKNLLLVDMTLADALNAYLVDARRERSKNDSVRDAYSGRLQRLSDKLAGTPIGRINSKILSQALPNKSDRTKAEYLSDLQHFVDYVEVQQRYECGLRTAIERVKDKLKLKDPNKSEAAAAKVASNSKILPDKAEEVLNNRIEQNLDNPRFVALAFAKGGGLSNADICALKVGDIQTTSNSDVTFVRLTKNYVSATQDYTFPLFPWESRLIHKYLQMLKKKYGPDRLAEDKYLLSSKKDTGLTPLEAKEINDGLTPLEAKEITELCRLELQKMRFGYAELIGNADLSRDKGITMLRSTYRARLEACGITKDHDEGAWLFMHHMTLGNNTQADHYRSFTAESGRQCLLDYVMQDRRFLPKQFSPYLYHTGRGSFTLRPEDDNAYQALIEFELNPPEIATIRTQTGANYEILAVEQIVDDVSDSNSNGNPDE